MQTKPADPSLTCLQALKQGANQLLENQRSLQQQIQALIAERDAIAQQRDGFQFERDALQAERVSLTTQLQEITAQRDSIQQERDGIQSERDQLAAQYEELAASREALQAERETLLEQQEALGLARDGLLAALRQVFPYSAYRDPSPDLASLNDQDLVDHFVAHGIHEGGHLTYSAMESELQHLRSSLEDANAKAELFNQKSSHTAAQLDLLKDLFTKMTVQP